MIQDITNFQFNGNKVRILHNEKGEPLWVAKDVCAILDYPNHVDVVKRLCRPDGVWNSYPIVDTLGRQQYPLCIDEGNLYRLIIKSTKPESERFEAWVCDEVIPAIRKTGGYTLHGNSVEIMESNYKFTMKRLDEVKAEKRKLVSHALEATPFWSNIKYYKDLGLSNTEIGRIIEKSSRFVGRSLKKMKALGIAPEAVPLPTLYRIAASRLEDQTTLLAAYRTRYPDADEDMMITYALPTREVDHE